MENGDNKNQIKQEPNIEEMDEEFLKELNHLSKQLKTDDEIINDYKLKNSIETETKNSINTENNIKPIENGGNYNNINSNININEMSDINELFKNNNLNINPFQEAYDLLNAKQNIFNLEDNNLMLESLDSLHSTITQFNSILNNTLGMDNNTNTNGTDKNGINEKENKILGNILDFLLQSSMLENTILNMKKSIEDSLQKNKSKLTKEENEKYKEALLNADNILNEAKKVHPDKDKIFDSLQKLHQISNDIESISIK
jgi:hypothetical protein